MAFPCSMNMDERDSEIASHWTWGGGGYSEAIKKYGERGMSTGADPPAEGQEMPRLPYSGEQTCRWWVLLKADSLVGLDDSTVGHSSPSQGHSRTPSPGTSTSSCQQLCGALPVRPGPAHVWLTVAAPLVRTGAHAY